MGSPSVLLATITRGDIHTATISTVEAIRKAHPEVIDWQRREKGPYLDAARNDVIRENFLPSDAEILFFIDSDIVLKTTKAFSQVIAGCTPETPLVGGIYWNPNGELHTINPLVYSEVTTYNEQGTLIRHHLEQFNGSEPELAYLPSPTNDSPSPLPDDESEWFKCGAIGTGFMAIHRTLIEHLATIHPEPQPWFREGPFGIPARNVGEDLWLCIRTRQAGFPVLAHRTARVHHIKPILI